MFRSVLEDRGFNPIRVDEETFVGSVLNAIWSSIRQSDLVIADITGSNPNVFYELGIAHALSKPVIITVYSEDGRVPENVPFDITDHRLVPYESAGDLAGKLDREILAVRSQTASGRRLDTDG